MNVGDPDTLVERQEPGQGVDRAPVLEVADHGHGLAGHGAQLAADGEDVKKGLSMNTFGFATNITINDMINVPFTTQPVYALSLLTTISIKKVL
jgi:hypothetical protein